MGLCMSNNKQEGGNAQKTENKPVDKKPAAAAEKEEEPKKAEEKKEEPKKAEEKKEEPKKAEEKKEEPKKEEPKKEEPKKAEEKKETPKAATAAAEGTQDSPKTGCEDYPLASGSYTLQDYEFDEKTKKTKAPNMSSWPAVTNNFVTDGKVVFDKAALSIPGIIPTRADEVKELERVFTLKGEASELTKEAATIHDASQPFFKEADEAHKAGEHEKKHAALNKGKAMMEDAKKLRAQAQEKHDLCNKIGRAVSISMAIKAAYSKEFEYNPWPSKTDTMYPSADWHVFTESAMEESIDAVWEVFSQNKFGCKSFLAIPGAGSHSTGPKGCVTIPVYKEFVKRHGFEKNETQITSGSWLLKF